MMFPLIADTGGVAWPMGSILSGSPFVQRLGEAGIALTLALVSLLELGHTRPVSRRKVERPPSPWVCWHCGMPNEIALGACWNCHLAKELHGPTPTHIPEGNRWRCSHCSVWNGVLRRGCWHCGLQREGPPPVPADIERSDREP